MTPTKKKWIEIGYEVFALRGENSLKIETLSKQVEISKSSFYHHFADLDVFVERLLAFHLEQAKIIAEKEKNVISIEPALINILLEHKTDLLFNRQLRFHQEDKRHQQTLQKSNQIIGKEFVRTWKNDHKLSLTYEQLDGLFELALENFFMQINPETVNYSWLSAYFDNLRQIAKNFS